MTRRTLLKFLASLPAVATIRRPASIPQIGDPDPGRTPYEKARETVFAQMRLERHNVYYAFDRNCNIVGKAVVDRETGTLIEWKGLPLFMAGFVTFERIDEDAITSRT